MPHLALHLCLAHSVRSHWSACALEPPFDPHQPSALNAFLHGAIGPDMGMYPGGDLLLSNLVHRVRAGRLARTLLKTAHTPTERGFAWGWLTHVLGDVLLHPVINTAAARRLGRTTIEWQDRRHGIEHVRVEFGLDAACIAAAPALRHVRLTPAFDRRTVGWLTAALTATYGPAFDDLAVLRSHLAVVRLNRHVLAMAEQSGIDHTPRPWAVARPALLRLARGSKLEALLDPVAPCQQLLLAAGEALELLPRLVERHRAARWALLDDFDLETGGLEDPDHPTANAAAALLSLGQRRVTLPELLPDAVA